MQVSHYQSHLKYGYTAGIWYACNALLAACWADVQSLAYWNSFDRDRVLDLGNDFLKNLGLKRYLDVTGLPHHVRTAEGYNFHVIKMHLYNVEAVIGRRERFILNVFRSRSCTILFKNL